MTSQRWRRSHRTGKWGRGPQLVPGPWHCHLSLGVACEGAARLPTFRLSLWLALRSQILMDLSCMAVLEMSAGVTEGLLPLSLMRMSLYNQLPEPRDLSILGKTQSP